jgi:hypothetical protein
VTRKPRTKLTAVRLRQVLAYNPATREFRWRVALSNRVRVGMVAGGAYGRQRRIWIDGARYAATRLVVLYLTGKWPPGANRP